jgi:ATP-dependent Clp protease ATP-binding subunit ClpB
MKVLDTTKGSPEAQGLTALLSKKIVGQEAAAKVLVDIIENYQAGFSDPTRPAGNALFLGPTGVGKTATVEAMCEALFGNKRACIKIDCAEFQHGHEIAKLVGSPPGYSRTPRNPSYVYSGGPRKVPHREAKAVCGAV